MIIELHNDLLSINSDYIAHQVNCRGVMGAGLALAIRQAYPDVYDIYREHCRNFKPSELLGKAFIHDRVISIFGQLNYGRNPNVVYTDYNALRRAFTAINRRLPESASIAFPYNFGCGLANGDWNIVKQLIVDCFPTRIIYIIKK